MFFVTPVVCALPSSKARPLFRFSNNKARVTLMFQAKKGTLLLSIVVVCASVLVLVRITQASAEWTVMLCQPDFRDNSELIRISSELCFRIWPRSRWRIARTGRNAGTLYILCVCCLVLFFCAEHNCQLEKHGRLCRYSGCFLRFDFELQKLYYSTPKMKASAYAVRICKIRREVFSI